MVYYDANLDEPIGNLAGPDNRPYFENDDDARRINDNINNAYVLGNYGGGYGHNLTFSAQKSFSNGFFFSAAYNFGVTKDLVSLGSTAGSSYRSGRTTTTNNNLELSFSDNDQRHRAIFTASYRKEYKIGATQISAFWEGRNLGRFSYVYNGDANNDDINGNDLIYIPTAEELQAMNFQDITSGANAPFTAEQQKAYFEQYIQQDKYLRANRGSYAERNGGILPWVARMDVSIVQDFFVNVAGKRNTFQFRTDIINAGNLINSDLGVARVTNNTQFISVSSIDANGVPTYQLQRTNGVLNTSTFRDAASLSDVWQLQFSLRYIFN